MFPLVGYALNHLLHRSERSSIYSAYRTSDGAAVILKLLGDEYPSAEAVTRLRREYELARVASGHGGVGILGLEPVQSSWAIVMEDRGARALSARLGARRLPLEEALWLGARIATALAALHGRHIVHKDLNPSNIIVSPTLDEVWLIDFGLSTMISRENPSLQSPNVLEGTLRYLSPEQTGRMNRAVDHRADLYSLGITLYELLLGHVPFQAADAVEFVHLHIAQRPVPPHEVDPTIPRTVSDVVMKLLAKTAEERYQSALGVKADLELCLAHLGAPGGEPPDFSPGHQDVSNRFLLPQRLYGREAEVAVLLETFERAAHGRAELLLVAGSSGVGKSALVQELHKPVVRRHGTFASGKFDQLQRDIPYASLVQAFTDIVRQLLTEKPERLEHWRQRLTQALGGSGQVLLDVVPDLERIVGPQPSTPGLPPTETQLRFHLVFQRFAQALATENHPLVLFLDDLQWADRPSLNLLQTLLTDPDCRHLLIIGAYRDNEVDGTHPLRMMLEAPGVEGTRLTSLTLAPLGLAHVEQLVGDTLHCEPERARPLARLAHERTEGNPFFLGQWLRILYEETLIDFDPKRFTWKWDLQSIRERGITANVVELMSRSIQRLPSSTQEVLQLAACLGARFDLATLAIVRQSPTAQLATELHQAIEVGLVLPVDERWKRTEQEGSQDTTYKFLHDRVQQAAYALIPEEQRAALHLRIGRLLLAATPEEQRDDRLFDIVHQLNRGLGIEHSPEERYETARLNLLAGRKARNSAAFEPALRFFTAGIALLPGDAWEKHHELSFELHAEAMDAEFANARLERSQAISELLLARARTPLEKIRVYETLAHFAIIRNEPQQSVEHGYRAMEMLGVNLPRNISMPELLAQVQAMRELLAAKTDRDLLEMPLTHEPQWLAVSRIGMMLATPLFNTQPTLSLAVQLEALQLCLRHGRSPEMPYFLGSIGMALAVFLGDLDAATRCGRLVLQFPTHADSKRYKAKLLQLVAGFTHWKTHWRASDPLLLESTQLAQESGEFEFMAHGAARLSMRIVYQGDPLDMVLHEQERNLALVNRYELKYATLVIRIAMQACLNLMGRAVEPTRLVGAVFHEDQLSQIRTNQNAHMESLIYVQKLMLECFFRQAETRVAEDAESYIQSSLGTVSFVIFHYYSALVWLLRCRTAPPEEQERLLEKVEQNQRKMKHWADHGPMNLLHRYQLVEAERARLRGDTVAASHLYEEAAANALKNRYLNDVALAHELAGEFYLSLGRERLARDCLLDAANAYRRWGAEAKVADLEQRYPQVFTRRADANPSSSEAPSHSSRGSTSALDASTVLKAAQALSGELVLERLVDTLMRFAIENAGAQRGLLLMERHGRLAIVAERSLSGPASAPLPAPFEGDERLSSAIVHYVVRTGESVVLDNAAAEGRFTTDTYVVQHAARSVLCAPLVTQGKRVALLYLENHLTDGAFTADRLEVLRTLLAQAALSLQNALLYDQLEDYSRTLEQKVEQRTHELQTKNEELGQTLRQLRDTQQQLVAQEKLASLGSITAGIAHELKNPLNFINNFSELLGELTEDLSTSLDSQRYRMEPGIHEDMSSTLATMRQNTQKIHEHGQRANQIINGMLLHSRAAASEREPSDLNAVLAESLTLLQHGLRSGVREITPEVHVNYDASLGAVELVRSELSRVFINLVANASHALRQKKLALGMTFTPRLDITTRNLGEHVEVRIRDNGTGIPAAHLNRVFDPFFTTKPPGEGTGLGLSISHDIIVGTHQGSLRLESREGEFTEAIIELPHHPLTRTNGLEMKKAPTY
ncbi:protein kinase [Cystobacter fuscus]|uniref:histidine kinase n=1 Tax=Cystobacter fuscus TaxID=43 RepID=A0A250J2P5_9BACT|nr:ATP-binding sensor histidine kinase [Cystobacter fuscus]ATB37436.1 protein kinase [Cystobacter fuscus]